MLEKHGSSVGQSSLLSIRNGRADIQVFEIDQYMDTFTDRRGSEGWMRSLARNYHFQSQTIM